jgi:transposase
MRTGRGKAPLEVTLAERRRWNRRPTARAPNRSWPGARLILLCGDGLASNVVARKLHVRDQTVSKWRGRFVRDRLEDLYDEPRPGGLADDHRRRRRAGADPNAGEDATRAHPLELAGDGEGDRRESHDHQPHLGCLWAASASHGDLQAVPRPAPDRGGARHCGPVHEPPEHAVVLCVDEKAKIQALDRTNSLPALRPGQVGRRTHDYTRHGTTSLFSALDVKTSQVLGQLHRRHRSIEFRKFLDAIDAAVPTRLAVHLIMDNYRRHKTALIRRWCAKRPRFHVQFTPTYGSWLNLVERWFAGLTTKQVRRGVHRSIAELELAIGTFIDAAPSRSYGPRLPTRSSRTSPASRSGPLMITPMMLWREPWGQDIVRLCH